jgi:hypothetical protein
VTHLVRVSTYSCGINDCTAAAVRHRSASAPVCNGLSVIQGYLGERSRQLFAPQEDRIERIARMRDFKGELLFLANLQNCGSSECTPRPKE